MKWNRLISWFLLILCLSQAGAMFFLSRKKPLFSKAVVKTESGTSYSLLINAERFPIPTRGEQFLSISVSGQPQEPLLEFPASRSIINFTDEQKAMARVTESRFRFYYDRPADLKTLYVNEKLNLLKRESDWETVLAVLRWSSKQFKSAHPDTYPSQNASVLIPLLRSGQVKGFCAQYCYVCVQALQSMGFFARYVTLLGHEVCEVWVPSLEQWVCLDPTSGSTFVDERGKRCSVLDIARGQGPLKVVGELPGNVNDFRARFRRLSYWLRNDLATHPINIYDLDKYKCRVIFSSDDFRELPPGGLYSVFPEELYSSPVVR